MKFESSRVRSLMKVPAPIVVSALCAMTLSHARAEWRLDAETGVAYDSNLSNSDRAADVHDDWAWKSDVRVGNGFQLTRDLRFNVAADLRGDVWDRFDDFNEIGAGAITGLRYRFGLGRLAPWILLENRFGYDRFQETERSGYEESINLRGGVSLSDRVAIEAGYWFQNYSAPDSFYDRQNHHVNARVVFDATSSLQLSAGYTYAEGDVISYAMPPRPDIRRLAEEVRPGEETFGGPPFFTAYKLLGRTHAGSFSAAYVLTKHLSVQLDYEYAVTTHDPLQYDNHIVAAKVLLTY